MAAPETLIPDARKEDLAAAAEKRFSCRKFESRELTSAEWSTLSYLCGRCALPGVRLIPLRCDEGLFGIPLVHRPMIRGVKTCVALVIDEDGQQSRLFAGCSGELLVLELTLMGIGTCWVTGTFRRSRAEEKARVSGESRLIGLIAAGSPAAAQGPRKRKLLREICASDPTGWAEGPRRAAELVRLAPSALNLQPWRISVEPTRLILDADSHNPRTALDVGIALCHAELACAGSHTWRFASSADEPYCWAE